MNENIIVNITCGNLRRFGRQALSGYWSLAVSGTLIFMLLILVPMFLFSLLIQSDVLDKASNLYIMIVNGPLTFGYYTLIISIFRRNPASSSVVFYGFEHFGKTFGLYIVMNILIFLWSLLFVIPGIVAAVRYSMAFYILADHPEIGIMDAIRESKRMMRGNKWKLFCLELSFIGWAIVGALTLGIGYLWVIPYMIASTVGFYELVNGNLRPAVLPGK
jgi:uncharacterized membrane protein